MCYFIHGNFIPMGMKQINQFHSTQKFISVCALKILFLLIKFGVFSLLMIIKICCILFIDDSIVWYCGFYLVRPHHRVVLWFLLGLLYTRFVEAE